jgi:hypothetical protein
MFFFFRDFLFAKSGLSLFFFPCLPPPSLLSLSFFPFLAHTCATGPAGISFTNLAIALCQGSAAPSDGTQWTDLNDFRIEGEEMNQDQNVALEVKSNPLA